MPKRLGTSLKGLSLGTIYQIGKPKKKQNVFIGFKKILKRILIITKSMCFVLIKSWSKYAKQNETVKLKFCEKTSSVI